ncbi:MAG: vWA domain-containing protein [Parachlamydiaceae bacterium]
MAFIDPAWRKGVGLNEIKKSFSPNEGIGIYLVLDQSGSMGEKGAVQIQDSQLKPLSKIDLLKEKAAQFIKHRPNDLIGLVAFARFPQVLTPLTMNHQVILDQLASLHVVKDRKLDGTAIGYALYKTAHLIASTQAFYQQKGHEFNAVIILVTDGLQDPNPLDSGHALRSMEMREAANFAKKYGIKIYMINIEPKLKEKQFEPNLKLLQRISSMTGGQFFLADGNQGIQKILEKIDQIEKKPLPISSYQQTQKKELYAYVLGLSLILIASYLILKLTYFRQVA